LGDLIQSSNIYSANAHKANNNTSKKWDSKTSLIRTITENSSWNKAFKGNKTSEILYANIVKKKDSSPNTTTKINDLSKEKFTNFQKNPFLNTNK
jgi:hypothetical protein